MLIYEEYVPKIVDPDSDRFLSPLLIRNDEIDALPPVRIVCAGMDPLHDQSYEFVVKLARRGVSVRLVDYSNLPHAFWSVEYPGTNKTLDKAVEFILDLLILNQMRVRKEMMNVDGILEQTY